LGYRRPPVGLPFAPRDALANPVPMLPVFRIVLIAASIAIDLFPGSLIAASNFQKGIKQDD
jgi:hypothetical protein